MTDVRAHESNEWPVWTRRAIETDTPSRRDGIPASKEARCRRTAGVFLAESGRNLKVPQLTIATATVFYNRFFVVQSLKHHDHMISEFSKNLNYLTGESRMQSLRQIIASSAMFLACKVEETPRNLIDVIKVTYTLQFRNDPDKLKLLSNKEVFHSRMDAVLFGERVLLHVLAFELDVSHPYIFIVEGRKRLPKSFMETEGLKLLQCAWNILNDSLKMSTLCLEHAPRDIGAAAFLLAARWTKMLPKLGKDGGAGFFRAIFHVSMSKIEEIAKSMLELYESTENNEMQGKGTKESRNDGSGHLDYRVRGDASGAKGIEGLQEEAIKDPLDLDHLEEGELPG